MPQSIVLSRGIACTKFRTNLMMVRWNLLPSIFLLVWNHSQFAICLRWRYHTANLKCRTSHLPAFFVFGKAPLDIHACATSMLECSRKGNKRILVWAKLSIVLKWVFFNPQNKHSTFSWILELTILLTRTLKSTCWKMIAFSTKGLLTIFMVLKALRRCVATHPPHNA